MTDSAARPRTILAVEQRDEPLGTYEQAVEGGRLIARQGPPAGKHAQVSSEAGRDVVQAHEDLPGSPEHLPRPPGAGRQRLGLPGTAASSCATRLDAQLALALTSALHPRSQCKPGAGGPAVARRTTRRGG